MQASESAIVPLVREAAVPDARSARLMAAETDVTPLSSADVRPGERRAARLAAAESPVLPMTQEQGLRATSRIVARESEVLPLTRPVAPRPPSRSLAARRLQRHPLAPTSTLRPPSNAAAQATVTAARAEVSQPLLAPELASDSKPSPGTAAAAPATTAPFDRLPHHVAHHVAHRQPSCSREPGAQTPVGPHRRPHQQTPRPATRPRPQAPLQPMRQPALRHGARRHDVQHAQPEPLARHARRPQPAPAGSRHAGRAAGGRVA